MGKIVYTGGTFDLFHPGHIELLRWCKRLAGENGTVVVAINTDEFIQRFKGKPPVMTYEEREQVVTSCRYVDYVVANIGDSDSKITISKFSKEVSPVDMVVIGSDWHGRDYLKQMGFTWEWLERHKISLCYIPRVTMSSSTNIKQRVKQQ